jgi:hypothetical protein
MARKLLVVERINTIAELIKSGIVHFSGGQKIENKFGFDSNYYTIFFNM